MKKVLVMVLFCTMVGSSVIAQHNLFNVDPGFTRQYTIELDKEEYMKVELIKPSQLASLPDADSLANVFLEDLKAIDVALSAPRYAKRIDLIIDGTGENKLRVHNWIRTEENFVVMGGKPARLKYEQDTITITGFYDTSGHYFRYTYYLNYYTNLAEYADGRLAQQVSDLNEKAGAKWTRNPSGGYSPEQGSHISSPAPEGKPATNNMLLLRTSMEVQNYREMFIPSVSLGLAVARRKNKIYQEFGISSELHFRFTKDVEGHNRTYINPFVTVSYGRGRETSPINPPLRLFPYISISYNTQSKGDVYEKNTFRIGVGRFFLGNMTTKIEPSFYISGPFKSATPSLRIVQMF